MAWTIRFCGVKLRNHAEMEQLRDALARLLSSTYKLNTRLMSNNYPPLPTHNLRRMIWELVEIMKIERSQTRKGNRMKTIRAFFLGMKEFRCNFTTHISDWFLQNAYDAGRGLAHRLTLHLWDR